MFETTTARAIERAGPSSVVRPNETRQSLLVWGEHCTECVMPVCYTSCSLYAPRDDLKCRRFAEGIVALPDQNALAVRFRKWGKLEAAGDASMLTGLSSGVIKGLDQLLQALFPLFGIHFRTKRRLVNGWNKLKAWLASKGSAIPANAVFLIEASNAESTGLPMTLTIKPKNTPGAYFQKRFDLIPGENRVEIPVGEIASFVDVASPLLYQIEPVGDAEGREVVFSCLDFVIPSRYPEKVLPKPTTQPAAKVKCVVWDLDNTMWHGTLIEDGLAKLAIRDDARRAVIELDRRGILNSIASKNNEGEALEALRTFGIGEYFVRPQISWGPKSEAINRIATLLNINKNSFAFVDDQAFERAEVASVHSDVRIFGDEEIEKLINAPECDVPVTAEGVRRREMYQQEALREIEFEQSSANFLDFLRSCKMELTIHRLGAANLNRIFELTQRTNQLNYAGRSIGFADLEAVVDDETREGFVLECNDRFGQYGIIGFCLLNRTTHNVDHFFMSCRVQGKRVDHAFFNWLRKSVEQQKRDVPTVTFKATGRNEPARLALIDMGLIPADDGKFVFGPDSNAETSEIVTIQDRYTAGETV